MNVKIVNLYKLRLYIPAIIEVIDLGINGFKRVKNMN